MFKTKIKVGSYYELKLDDKCNIAFAVMYGFDSGKNKDVYSLMIYTKNKIFEFPVKESLFDEWASNGRIKEITSNELLFYVL